MYDSAVSRTRLTKASSMRQGGVYVGDRPSRMFQRGCRVLQGWGASPDMACRLRKAFIHTLHKIATVHHPTYRTWVACGRAGELLLQVATRVHILTQCVQLVDASFFPLISSQGGFHMLAAAVGVVFHVAMWVWPPRRQKCPLSGQS